MIFYAEGINQARYFFLTILQVHTCSRMMALQTCMERCAFSSLHVCSYIILSLSATLVSVCVCAIICARPQPVCLGCVINHLAHMVQQNRPVQISRRQTSGLDTQTHGQRADASYGPTSVRANHIFASTETRLCFTFFSFRRFFLSRRTRKF